MGDGEGRREEEGGKSGGVTGTWGCEEWAAGVGLRLW